MEWNILILQLILLSGGSVYCDKGCPFQSTCLPGAQCNFSEVSAVIHRCEVKHWCCPNNAIIVQYPIGVRPITRQSVNRPRPTRNPHRNMHLLPHEECGLSIIGDRIRSGTVAKFGQFPWMVLLAFRVNPSSRKTDFLCGGTLINNRYVMTAAHCGNIARVGQPVSVRLGEHDLSQPEVCEDSDEMCADLPIDIPIERVYIHPRYNTSTLKNDIALIRLERDVNVTSYIVPICLPFHFNVTGEEEKLYSIAGWGKTEHANENGSNLLQFSPIWSSPLSECNQKQPEAVKPLDHTQLCAGGYMGIDACKRDSGGPLSNSVADTAGIARTYQLGIVSFGTVPCGSEGIPTVYTRVSAYLGWILNKLKP